VAIEVADEGPGMSHEELEHVFERFWRADSGVSQSVGGTGLGLAIAKSVMDLHGGSISASSEDEGMVFRITLPVTRGRTQARRPQRKVGSRR
jgi:signal transduction histidine kinase